MISSAVVSRYANALADVVTDPGAASRPEQVTAELRSFEEALNGSPELVNALLTPAVSLTRKRAVVAAIAGQLELSRIARNFLFVLVDHRRITGLGQIIDAFEKALDERLGFTRAEISSAAALDEPQRTALVAELERLTGKRVRPRFSTDPELIGGVMARIGSTVYDGSVRGQLDSLSRRLKAG